MANEEINPYEHLLHKEDFDTLTYNNLRLVFEQIYGHEGHSLRPLPNKGFFAGYINRETQSLWCSFYFGALAMKFQEDRRNDGTYDVVFKTS